MSQWKFLGFGTVISNNLAGKENIDIWLAELDPTAKGDLSKSTSVGSIQKHSSISAKWYCTHDGRLTPPNVAAGETVEVYQYGNDPTYYWVSHGRQPALRTLEHVTFAYSNLPNPRTSPAFTPETSYGITYSTREKHIKLWTSNNNGEAFKYTFFLDTKNSQATLKDDIGNQVSILSPNNEVSLKTAADAYLSLLQKDIFLKGTSIQIQGDTIILDAPNVHITGQLTVKSIHTAGLVCSGSMAAGGSAQVGGSMQVSGSVSASSMQAGSLSCPSITGNVSPGGSSPSIPSPNAPSPSPKSANPTPPSNSSEL